MSDYNVYNGSPLLVTLTTKVNEISYNNVSSSQMHQALSNGMSISINHLPPSIGMMYGVFTELNDLFNTNLTSEQIDRLNELYNTGDVANKTIAAELFKSILNNNDK